MRLRTWLKRQKMSQAAFARLIGSDQAHISGLVNGKHRPRLDMLVAIEKATKGAVQLKDWLRGK